jgi:hypothetical protein
MDLNLQSILVVVPLCIGMTMEPTLSCLPRHICCRWCLVVMEVVVAVAQAGDDAKVVVAKALIGDGYLWLAAALLFLLDLLLHDLGLLHHCPLSGQMLLLEP